MRPNFCPQCGHALDRRALDDGRERPVCPACGFVFYLNPVIAATVLVERDGKILLVLRGENPGKGLWGLPGGFMEADETIEQAAARECLEETGLKIALGETLGVWSYFHDLKNTSGVVIIYAARVIDGEPRAASDSLQVKFFAPAEIDALTLAFSSHREAIASWKEKHVTGHKSHASK